jgi:hypothetical protein
VGVLRPASAWTEVTRGANAGDATTPPKNHQTTNLSAGGKGDASVLLTSRRIIGPRARGCTSRKMLSRRLLPSGNCCRQARVLKNSIFFKIAKIWGIENV